MSRPKKSSGQQSQELNMVTNRAAWRIAGNLFESSVAPPPAAVKPCFDPAKGFKETVADMEPGLILGTLRWSADTVVARGGRASDPSCLLQARMQGHGISDERWKPARPDVWPRREPEPLAVADTDPNISVLALEIDGARIRVEFINTQGRVRHLKELSRRCYPDEAGLQAQYGHRLEGKRHLIWEPRSLERRGDQS
jgi:hypothetical protein